jgi:protein SCO1
MTRRISAGAMVFVIAGIWAISTVNAPAAPPVTVATLHYAVPAVTLIRQDGKEVALQAEMNDGRPVVLNFIFTTCGSICPLMSQVFGQFQRRLGADSDQVHLMSISTDPEEDSPARLREYAQRYGARVGWNHYTGTLEASQSVQRAFGVYRGDKMSHTSVTLLRVAPGQPWVRIDGFMTPDELLRHFRQLLAAR